MGLRMFPGWWEHEKPRKKAEPGFIYTMPVETFSAAGPWPFAATTMDPRPRRMILGSPSMGQ